MNKTKVKSIFELKSKSKLDIDLVKKMGFREPTETENRLLKNAGDVVFIHDKLELYIYSDHTNNQVVSNFLRHLVYNYDKELNLDRFLMKIY